MEKEPHSQILRKTVREVLRNSEWKGEYEMSMQERELNDEDVREEFLPLPQAATRYVWDDAYDTPIHYIDECCRAYFLEGKELCVCSTINVMHNFSLQVLTAQGYWTDLLRQDGVWGYQVVKTAPLSSLHATFIAVE